MYYGVRERLFGHRHRCLRAVNSAQQRAADVHRGNAGIDQQRKGKRLWSLPRTACRASRLAMHLSMFVRVLRHTSTSGRFVSSAFVFFRPAEFYICSCSILQFYRVQVITLYKSFFPVVVFSYIFFKIKFVLSGIKISHQSEYDISQIISSHIATHTASIIVEKFQFDR